MRPSSSSSCRTLLDAGEVEPDLGREPLDQPQPLHVRLGVEPRVPRGALGPDEPLLLVDPQRLGMHPDELRGDGDHVAGTLVDHGARPVVHQRNNLSRGFAFDTFLNPSSASRSAFVSLAGTAIFSRASRSPRPVPLSFGAP